MSEGTEARRDAPAGGLGRRAGEMLGELLARYGGHVGLPVTPPPARGPALARDAAASRRDVIREAMLAHIETHGTGDPDLDELAGTVDAAIAEHEAAVETATSRTQRRRVRRRRTRRLGHGVRWIVLLAIGALVGAAAAARMGIWG